MTHFRVCVPAAKNSISSLDHYGEARTLDYLKDDEEDKAMIILKIKNKAMILMSSSPFHWLSMQNTI